MQAWHDFYLLIGTAGAALTGLLFVVVSLGLRVVARDRTTGVRAFLSPNAVHFTATLVVSAMFLVPDLSPIAIGARLCVGSTGALVYSVITRAHRNWRHNELDLLDWIWFVALPVASYGLLLAAGLGFVLGTPLSMYGVAVVVILLLVVALRNAWDIVIWMSREEHV
ncbi:MAG TPA: hypothetical protein VGI14_23035 [Casimicrobiaceae bacterium]